MKPLHLAIELGGIGLVAGVGWFVSDSFYLKPARELDERAGEFRRRIEGYDAATKGWRETRIALRELSSSMLAGEQVVVEHRLRNLLSELAEREGLREIVVSHGRPRVEPNPAQERGSGVSRGLRRMLSEQQDFVVVRARLQGLGTLERVTATLASARAQPWLHRVEGFTIAPKGKEKSVYELKADLATVYAPDLVDAEAGPPELTQPVAADARLASAVAERSPFRLADPAKPADPKPRPVAKKKDPPPPPPPPYNKWRVTGVIEVAGDGGNTMQVMLARTDTGELRTLNQGDSILEARLDSASGESAYFTLKGERYVVRTGQTLAQRQPAESVHSG
jgi:hypothetical protein